MNAEQFVDTIRAVVIRSAAADMVTILEHPPGRTPDPQLLEISAWFRQLPDADREIFERALHLVSRNAVFGLLAVLDGARKVDPSSESPNHFELRHVHGADVDILSGPHGAVLHDLL